MGAHPVRRGRHRQQREKTGAQMGAQMGAQVGAQMPGLRPLAMTALTQSAP